MAGDGYPPEFEDDEDAGELSQEGSLQAHEQNVETIPATVEAAGDTKIIEVPGNDGSQGDSVDVGLNAAGEVETLAIAANGPEGSATAEFSSEVESAGAVEGEVVSEGESDESAAPALPECGHWDVDADTYHADRTAVSSSTAKKYRVSPLAYFEEIVLGNGNPWKTTEAKEFGKAFHAMLLEPDVFEKEYIFAPETFNGEKIDKRKGPHKKFWEDFERAAAGKSVLKWELKVKMEAMIRRFHENPSAAEVFVEGSLYEYPIRFFCEDLQCKAMFDVVNPRLDIAWNIKTCADIDQTALSRDIYEYDYHVADALYRHGYEQVFGRPLKEHRFVWCNKESVNEVLVTRLDPVSQKIGEYELRKTLRAMVQSLTFDEFQIPGHGQVNELGIPYWAINRYNLDKLSE